MAISQMRYRFGGNSGTEATHPWLAGENRGVARQPAAAGQFLLRLCLQETAGAAHANLGMNWQYRHTPRSTGVPGNWTNVTTTSAVARTGSTTVFTNGQNCTRRLGGTGTFEASGAGCTHDGTAGGAANDIVANGCSETLIGLQIIGADTAVGDLIEFRVVDGTGTPFAAYDAVPTVRVAAEILAVQSRDASLHTSLTSSVARISGTQVAVEATGMSGADLADSTLTMEMNVWGTTLPGSTDPADYTVHLFGPAGWGGGVTGKDGLPVKPAFGFQAEMPEGVVRVLATFQPSRAVTFGAQATLSEAPA